MFAFPPSAAPDFTRRRLLRSAAAGALAAFVGCESKPAAVPPEVAPSKATAQKLRLLVIDDSDFGSAIAREWQARTESEIELQTATAAELVQAKRLPADVVITASAAIGELIERGLVVPLDPKQLADEAFARQDIFELTRREMSWGNQPFAIPLGSPQLLLVYRPDIFEHLQLKPPQTWLAYRELLEKLKDRVALGHLGPRPDAPWQACAEPLAKGWAAQTLLARAAPYALHRDQVSPLFDYTTFEPLIAAPPFQRALEELADCHKHLPENRELFTPADAYEALYLGRCAMALTWPQRLSEAASDAFVKSRPFPLACSELPGSPDVFNPGTQAWEPLNAAEDSRAALLAISGRVGLVTATSADPRRAQGFLQWLASGDDSSRICSQSRATTLFRNSQVPAAERWLDARPPKFADVLQAAQSRARWMWSLRLPGHVDYLAELHTSVMAAIRGEQSPADALLSAAKKWREITANLGLPQQLQAHRRNLGLENIR